MDTNNAKSLFKDMDYELLNNDAPSKYLERISSTRAFMESPYHMLVALKSTEQSPIHHPEGSVWNHTMLVLDEAAKMRSKSKDPRVLMWAALLHDIGKPGTTQLRNGKITSYNHDKLGAKLARKFLMELTEEPDFINDVTALVRWHMQIMFVTKNMAHAKTDEMIKETDIHEIVILGLCDRLGRLNPDKQAEIGNVKTFLKALGHESALEL